MIQNILGRILANMQLRKLERLPAFQVGREFIQKNWLTSNELTKDFSEKLIDDVSKEMMEVVIQVVTSENPRMANRELLTNWILELSKFQVLVLDSSEEDPTGLVGIDGISGGLKEHLVKLSQESQKLREFLFELGENLSKDQVWDTVLLRYRVCYSWCGLHNALRVALHDFAANKDRDWYVPFYKSMCIWQEYCYRDDLGLPQVLSGDVHIKALQHSAFMNIVASGNQQPLFEWQEMLREVAGS